MNQLSVKMPRQGLTWYNAHEPILPPRDRFKRFHKKLIPFGFSGVKKCVKLTDEQKRFPNGDSYAEMLYKKHGNYTAPPPPDIEPLPLSDKYVYTRVIDTSEGAKQWAEIVKKKDRLMKLMRGIQYIKSNDISECLGFCHLSKMSKEIENKPDMKRKEQEIEMQPSHNYKAIIHKQSNIGSVKDSPPKTNLQTHLPEKVMAQNQGTANTLQHTISKTKFELPASLSAKNLNAIKPMVDKARASGKTVILVPMDNPAGQNSKPNVTNKTALIYPPGVDCPTPAQISIGPEQQPSYSEAIQQKNETRDGSEHIDQPPPAKVLKLSIDPHKNQKILATEKDNSKSINQVGVLKDVPNLLKSETKTPKNEIEETPNIKTSREEVPFNNSHAANAHSSELNKSVSGPSFQAQYSAVGKTQEKHEGDTHKTADLLVKGPHGQMIHVKCDLQKGQTVPNITEPQLKAIVAAAEMLKEVDKISNKKQVTTVDTNCRQNINIGDWEKATLVNMNNKQMMPGGNKKQATPVDMNNKPATATNLNHQAKLHTVNTNKKQTIPVDKNKKQPTPEDTVQKQAIPNTTNTKRQAIPVSMNKTEEADQNQIGVSDLGIQDKKSVGNPMQTMHTDKIHPSSKLGAFTSKTVHHLHKTAHSTAKASQQPSATHSPIQSPTSLTEQSFEAVLQEISHVEKCIFPPLMISKCIQTLPVHIHKTLSVNQISKSTNISEKEFKEIPTEILNYETGEMEVEVGGSIQKKTAIQTDVDETVEQHISDECTHNEKQNDNNNPAYSTPSLFQESGNAKMDISDKSQTMHTAKNKTEKHNGADSSMQNQSENEQIHRPSIGFTDDDIARWSRKCCMMHCCADSITFNYDSERSEKITFHKIPEDTVMRHTWLVNMQSPKTNKSNLESLYVCSIHFNDRDFVDETMKKLKDSAVPSRHLWSKGPECESKNGSKGCQCKNILQQHFDEISIDFNNKERELKDLWMSFQFNFEESKLRLENIAGFYTELHYKMHISNHMKQYCEGNMMSIFADRIEDSEMFHAVTGCPNIITFVKLYEYLQVGEDEEKIAQWEKACALSTKLVEGMYKGEIEQWKKKPPEPSPKVKLLQKKLEEYANKSEKDLLEKQEEERRKEEEDERLKKEKREKRNAELKRLKEEAAEKKRLEDIARGVIRKKPHSRGRKVLRVDSDEELIDGKLYKKKDLINGRPASEFDFDKFIRETFPPLPKKEGKTELLSIDELFLTLFKLKMESSFIDLAIVNNMDAEYILKTVSKWQTYMYILLGGEEVSVGRIRLNLPDCVKDLHPKLRLAIDGNDVSLSPVEDLMAQCNLDDSADSEIGETIDDDSSDYETYFSDVDDDYVLGSKPYMFEPKIRLKKGRDGKMNKKAQKGKKSSTGKSKGKSMLHPNSVKGKKTSKVEHHPVPQTIEYNSSDYETDYNSSDYETYYSDEDIDIESIDPESMGYRFEPSLRLKVGRTKKYKLKQSKIDARSQKKEETKIKEELEDTIGNGKPKPENIKYDSSDYETYFSDVEDDYVLGSRPYMFEPKIRLKEGREGKKNDAAHTDGSRKDNNEYNSEDYDYSDEATTDFDSESEMWGYRYPNIRLKPGRKKKYKLKEPKQEIISESKGSPPQLKMEVYSELPGTSTGAFTDYGTKLNETDNVSDADSNATKGYDGEGMSDTDSNATRGYGDTKMEDLEEDEQPLYATKIEPDSTGNISITSQDMYNPEDTTQRVNLKKEFGIGISRRKLQGIEAVESSLKPCAESQDLLQTKTESVSIKVEIDKGENWENAESESSEMSSIQTGPIANDPCGVDVTSFGTSSFMIKNEPYDPEYDTFDNTENPQTFTDEMGNMFRVQIADRGSYNVKDYTTVHFSNSERTEASNLGVALQDNEFKVLVNPDFYESGQLTESTNAKSQRFSEQEDLVQDFGVNGSMKNDQAGFINIAVPTKQKVNVFTKNMNEIENIKTELSNDSDFIKLELPDEEMNLDVEASVDSKLNMNCDTMFQSEYAMKIEPYNVKLDKDIIMHDNKSDVTLEERDITDMDTTNNANEKRDNLRSINLSDVPDDWRTCYVKLTKYLGNGAGKH